MRWRSQARRIRTFSHLISCRTSTLRMESKAMLINKKLKRINRKRNRRRLSNRVWLRRKRCCPNPLTNRSLIILPQAFGGLAFRVATLHRYYRLTFSTGYLLEGGGVTTMVTG